MRLPIVLRTLQILYFFVSCTFKVQSVFVLVLNNIQIVHRLSNWIVNTQRIQMCTNIDKHNESIG